MSDSLYAVLMKVYALTSHIATGATVEKHAKTSVADWIVEQFKKRVAAGEFTVGKRLPSQFELAKSMNVGRSSIREAMRELQALGLIELKTGSGAYLVSSEVMPRPARNSSASSEKEIDWFREATAQFTDLFEVRLAIEPAAAKFAAMRAYASDIRKLRETCESYDLAVDQADIKQVVALDEQFHRCIIQMSHNPLFLQINELLTQALRNFRSKSYTMKSHLTMSIEPHWDIFRAIESRDEDAAELHMTRHLSIAQKSIAVIAYSRLDAPVDE